MFRDFIDYLFTGLLFFVEHGCVEKIHNQSNKRKQRDRDEIVAKDHCNAS